ncbi:hypothetical protein RND81_03G168600 [Saponaria officinalis]|uniref:Uncharacterized protein n=1 Tax=Saponaria officinalis TaxID=3572 RepID=A0AAW1M4K7_SAPOF
MQRNNLVLFWEQVRGIPIIQEAIQQNEGSCALAAISTHIGYNLRISYVWDVRIPVNIPAGILVDHLKWEEEIKKLVGEPVKNLTVLFEDAKVNGVPLWNGMRLKIDNSYRIMPLNEGALRTELWKYTVLAVLRIHEDYSEHGEMPYMGRKGIMKDKYGNMETHTVVLVGEYRDNSLFAENEATEALWIYQNSDGIRELSFLDNGLNVVKNSLVLEAYCIEIYASNPLLEQEAVNMLQRTGLRQEARAVPEVLLLNRELQNL